MAAAFVDMYRHLHENENAGKRKRPVSIGKSDVQLQRASKKARKSIEAENYSNSAKKAKEQAKMERRRIAEREIDRRIAKDIEEAGPSGERPKQVQAREVPEQVLSDMEQKRRRMMAALAKEKEKENLKKKKSEKRRGKQ